MTRAAIVVELSPGAGLMPVSVNYLRGDGRHWGGKKRQVQAWEGYIEHAMWLTLGWLTDEQRDQLLGIKGEIDGWSITLEWIGRKPTGRNDLGNIEKGVTDGVMKACRRHREDCCTDFHINLNTSERIDRPRLLPGEEDRRFLRVTLACRNRRRLNREEWEAVKAAAGRNGLLEKIAQGVG